MTIEELLKKYKKKYPGVPYEIVFGTAFRSAIISRKKGKFHSYSDAPSVITEKGKHVEWHKDGKIHRENDKPAIIWSNGTKFYFYHGIEYDPTNKPEYQKKRIEKLTTKKSPKQKQREDLLKEFIVEMLGT